ncbi:MAG: ferritin-like domain-containing protein [Ilumatobacteraceae bacterium]
MTVQPSVDVGGLGLDGGAHLLVKLALRDAPTGVVAVHGWHPDLVGQLATWCRQEGHRLRVPPTGTGGPVASVERGPSARSRWVGATRAGGVDDSVVDRPSADWGLAARGAMVEAGGPTPAFALDDRDAVWTDRARRLYAQAAAAQWDPDAAIDWAAPIANAAPVEDAVVQLMTFLIENEEAALVVPARFLGQVHPHFREIQQVLAVTVADEARHIDVFTRRATLGGAALGLSTVGGRASLQTLLDEPDFATASFLLSVMGEGTFVSLLGFLERHAPDPLTRRIAHLTRQDEARHVAFALGHLERHAELDPTVRPRLARAVERRHAALRTTAGLNDEVFDALVLLAAGATTPTAVAAGWQAVHDLQRDMDESRRARLARLGFTPGETEELSALHTRNFM